MVWIILSSFVSYGENNRTDLSKKMKVVLFVLNRIEVQDLDQMPRLKELMQESSVALMNTKASGSNNEFKSYATLGWGVRSEVSQSTSLFYKVDDEIRAIYERRTGSKIPESGIVSIDIGKLIEQNKKGEYGAIPGELGNVLRENGYKTAVLGNMNAHDVQLTPAALIAMDSKGYIDYGDISDELIEEDITRPFGIKTNYSILSERLRELYAASDFIVIELGDIARLERYKENVYSEVYEEYRRELLVEIDDFIGKIAKDLKEDSPKILITTPYPSSAAINRGERLTPLIIYDGKLGEKVLYSDTTKREGIVGNVDIGQTVLSYFDLSSDHMTGTVLKSIPKEDAWDYIKNVNLRVVNTSVQRARVLYSFAIYEILISIVAFIFIMVRKKLSPHWYQYILFALAGNMVVPLTLLIMPVFGVTSVEITYLLLVGITTCIVLLMNRFTKNHTLNTLLSITALLVFALIVDIVTGQNLIKNSLLGYDPIIGARYYGIGNEYMGILIGATIIFTTVLIEKYAVNIYGTILFYIFVVLVIGLPSLGANVGGTITAVAAFIFVSIRLSGARMDIKKIIYTALGIVGAVAIMAGIDLFISDSPTHLAGAIKQITAGGPIVVYQIIMRKISMNLRLIGITVWSKVLISAIVILGMLLYRPIGHIKNMSSKYSKVGIGWTGIIVACIVGFSVNDSGIVAAATSIIFLTSSILYLIIDDLS